MQGYGNILSEELDYNPTTGQLITDGTWEYKPPSSQDIQKETKKHNKNKSQKERTNMLCFFLDIFLDIPIDYRVTILRNAPNPYGVLSSKATGEPPLVSSCAVLLAVKDAIENARYIYPSPLYSSSSSPLPRPLSILSCFVIDAHPTHRSAAGVTAPFDLHAPCTVDIIQTLCQTDISQYTF